MLPITRVSPGSTVPFGSVAPGLDGYKTLLGHQGLGFSGGFPTCGFLSCR
jgi:hypothetical protein